MNVYHLQLALFLGLACVVFSYPSGGGGNFDDSEEDETKEDVEEHYYDRYPEEGNYGEEFDDDTLIEDDYGTVDSTYGNGGDRDEEVCDCTCKLKNPDNVNSKKKNHVKKPHYKRDENDDDEEDGYFVNYKTKRGGGDEWPYEKRKTEENDKDGNRGTGKKDGGHEWPYEKRKTEENDKGGNRGTGKKDDSKKEDFSLSLYGSGEHRGDKRGSKGERGGDGSFKGGLKIKGEYHKNRGARDEYYDWDAKNYEADDKQPRRFREHPRDGDDGIEYDSKKEDFSLKLYGSEEHRGDKRGSKGERGGDGSFKGGLNIKGEYRKRGGYDSNAKYDEADDKQSKRIRGQYFDGFPGHQRRDDVIEYDMDDGKSGKTNKYDWSPNYHKTDYGRFPGHQEREEDDEVDHYGSTPRERVTEERRHKIREGDKKRMVIKETDGQGYSEGYKDKKNKDKIVNSKGSPEKGERHIDDRQKKVQNMESDRSFDEKSERGGKGREGMEDTGGKGKERAGKVKVQHEIGGKKHGDGMGDMTEKLGAKDVMDNLRNTGLDSMGKKVIKGVGKNEEGLSGTKKILVAKDGITDQGMAEHLGGMGEKLPEKVGMTDVEKMKKNLDLEGVIGKSADKLGKTEGLAGGMGGITTGLDMNESIAKGLNMKEGIGKGLDTKSIPKGLDMKKGIGEGMGMKEGIAKGLHM